MDILYPWAKWIHIMAVISWMAALFYLPRLFVYHVETVSDEAKKTFETMELKLMKVIMTPAMLVTWISGILLIGAAVDLGSEQWIILKVLLVLAMTAFHGMCGKWRKEFLAGSSTRTGKFFRIMNEVPTVLMAVIIGLVVFKPF